jgi:uncharacterized protein
MGCTLILPSGRRVQIVRYRTAPTQATVTDPDPKGVRIKGYLSTWSTVDRHGEYVVRGAFTQSPHRFLENPLMLAEHDRERIAGKWTRVGEDDRGLYVEGTLSDSPAEWMRDLRFKVVERSACTLSMGGVFYYGSDGRGIVKVDLYEGSIVALPSNPEARFTLA